MTWFDRLQSQKSDPNQQSAPKEIPVTAPTQFIKGIDVSHYTNGVNFKTAKSDGVKFVYAKATDGLGTVDSQFQNFRHAVKGEGLLFGGYHFLRFDYDIQKQMDLMLKVLDGVRGELQPVVDVEWDKYSQHYGDGKEMDMEAASRASQALRALEAEGYKPILYTNFYFFTGFKDTAQFTRYPLWISNYQAKTLQDVKIPAPWKSATFWQYSGDKPGYGVDKMDFNYFLEGEAALNALVR